MKKPSNQTFPTEVIAALKAYVYRLIDPRNGETFYVGKGNGNRVFSHIRAEQNLEGDNVENKIKRIRDIHHTGLEVGHLIHRHGMDEKTALEVEAALIDAFPGLTNIAGGTGNNEYGAMHANEIILRYAAEIAVFRDDDKIMLIKVNKSAAENSPYEAARHSWRISLKKAKQAKYVLAVVQGLIVDAFKPKEWLEATEENFLGRDAAPGRIGFNRDEKDEGLPEIRRLYVGKRIPDEYRKPGAAAPVRYTW